MDNFGEQVHTKGKNTDTHNKAIISVYKSGRTGINPSIGV